jgi:hypothetical protein
MKNKWMRDKALYLNIFSAFGGISFGVWQRSSCAGIFAFFFLSALFYIGWIIECGDVYKDD